MLFNNFSVSQTSDNMLDNYATTISKEMLNNTACDSNIGGVRDNLRYVTHIDANQLGQSHLNRFPGLTHADVQQSAEGYDDSEKINAIIPVTNQRAHVDCVNSPYNPVSHIWECIDDADEGLPTMYSKVHLPGTTIQPNARPTIFCSHDNTATDVSLFRRRASTATGQIGVNTTETYTQNFTMFCVFKPQGNSDTSNGMHSGFRMMSSPGNADYIELALAGDQIKFKVGGGSLQQIAVDTEGDCGIVGRVKFKKWDFSKVHNGNNELCDTMIFCITYMGQGWVGLKPQHSECNHPSNPLYHDKTFWHIHDGVNEEYYRAELTNNDCLIIENQYGVLLNDLNGFTGDDAFDLRFINTSSGGYATSLQGHFCEYLVTGQPISQKKRLHILSHLRRKWGIPDSYENGLPYHN